MGGDIFNVHAHMSHHMPHTILPTESTPSHNTIITAGGSHLLTHVHMQLEPRLDVSHACAYRTVCITTVGQVQKVMLMG